MKTLNIPKHDFSACENVFDKMKQVQTYGAEASIDEINWKKDFPFSLPVSVYAAHNGSHLHLFYTVKNEALRAENTEDFGSVWEDSCVEFFMQREGERTYRNFECNALGALLASKRENRNDAEKLIDIMPIVFRFSTIQHRYENKEQVSDWTLYLEIPKEAMGFLSTESLSGNIIKANFYKCGDKTRYPHFQSWSPIDLPVPDFHVPQFFGTLLFE